MDINELSATIKVQLDKSGVPSDLKQIQKIVNNNVIKITPKLETASLQSSIKQVSQELTATLNNSLGANLQVNDVFNLLNNNIKGTIASTQTLASQSSTAADAMTNAASAASNAAARINELSGALGALHSDAAKTDFASPMNEAKSAASGWLNALEQIQGTASTITGFMDLGKNFD